MAHISVPGDGDAGSPLDVVVVIIKCIGKVGDIGVGVPGSHFSLIIWMCSLFAAGTPNLLSTPGYVRRRLDSISGSCSLGVPILEGLVHQLDCAGLGKVGVCVDDVGHPFEPLVCSLVLTVDVEAGVGGILPGEGLVLLLGSWCMV